MGILSKEELVQFIESNKSNFTRQLKYYHKDLYELINSRFDYPEFSQKLYHYIHGIDIGKCPVCNSLSVFDGINKGYRKYCSYECSGKAKKDTAREIRTCKICDIKFEIYKKTEKSFCSDKCRLINNKLNAKERVAKSIETNKRNHGGVYSLCLPEHLIKSNKTKLMKYGNVNYNNTERAKQTKLERYGDSNYNNKEKNYKTKLTKYGDGRYNNRNKFLSTMIDLYGGCTLSSDILKQKVRRTMVSRYGVEFPIQNSDIVKRAIETKRIYYNGFGNNVDKIKETWKNKSKDEIQLKVDKYRQTCLDRYNVPNTFMSHKSNGISISKVQRKYYEQIKQQYPDAILEHYLSDVHVSVDIFIPSENRIVEIYGDYWHCNPKLFLENSYHSQLHMNAADKWKIDLERQAKLEFAGYTVDIIWESDII